MIANKIARLFDPSNALPTNIRPRDLEYMHASPVYGIPLRPMEALQLSTVRACFMAVSNAIASSSCDVVKIDGLRVEKQPKHKLNYILNTRANPDMTAIAVKEALVISAMGWGDGYAEIVKTNGGRTEALWPFPSDTITMDRNAQGELIYLFKDGAGEPYVIPAYRMFHLRGLSINGLFGDSTLTRAARTLANALAAERFTGNFLHNGTVFSGTLEHPGVIGDKTRERLIESWKKRYQGPDKAHKTVLLEEGVKYTPIQIDAQKAQMVETRKFNIEEICRWFGVPPHKVQHLERMTFNNVEHLGIEFVRDALTPWALRFEQEADYKLFNPRDPLSTKIDLMWLAHGDAKSRAEYYQIMRRIGAYSVNDILLAENQNTIGPAGDVRIVESNMQKLDQLLEDAPEEDEEDDSATMALEAMSVTAIGGAFGRYLNMVSNRKKDLDKQGVSGSRLDEGLLNARNHAENRLVSECQGVCVILANHSGTALDFRGVLHEGLQAIDSGVPFEVQARLTVDQLMGRIANA